MKMDLIVLALVAVTGGFGGWKLCANYGEAARKYAAVVAELQDTNRKLQVQEAEDKRIEITEEDRAAKQDAEFAADLSRIPKCILVPAQVEALNKVGAE
jgi:hypothetical protein